jgi:alpha-L-fucosidase
MSSNKDPMRILRLAFIVVLLVMLPLRARTTEEVQRDFTELRFGMFIHFSIMTFTGDPWATPNQDVNQFNPTNLDCNQWADAAASAKMKFGILTTKHHDGFCLWDSAYTTNDVASSPWKSGHGDVVREYVNAFRSRGLEPCLYYSVWDVTKGIEAPITSAKMDFIKGQITELLTNYGDIKMLFIDGWSWKMGHKAVSCQIIRELVKQLQPGCLLVDNTHLWCLYDNDMIHYESGGPYPANNTLSALLSRKINTTGGNDWFWAPNVPTASLMSVNDIVSNNLAYLEPQWCVFVLNCPPNREGRLDTNVVNRLAEVGQAWSPNLSRPPLPAQQPQMEHPITPLSATATSATSGHNASYAIDGLNDRYYYSVWQSSTSLPQSITINLGIEHPDVCILYYVPKYVSVLTPKEEGSIKSYRIYKSTNGTNFTEIASGVWNGDTTMKVATFTPTNARYIQLEALSGVNGFAAATEVSVGAASQAATYSGLVGGGDQSDFTPPSPNPMTWAIKPHANGVGSIAMSASTVGDPSGVEYYFTCTAGGGHNSGWQSTPSYTDTGLTPGVTYTYTVKAYDISPNQNQTAASTAASAIATPWIYGDFATNGIVNIEDLPGFLNIWLEDDYNKPAGLDLNDDCIINFYEYAFFAQNWLKGIE